MKFRISVIIHAFSGNLLKIGEVVIYRDRILFARLNIPVYKKKIPTQKSKVRDSFHKMREEKFEVHEIKNAYAFRIEKNCKAELPYQKFGLTHQLFCKELQDLYPNNLYIKLSGLHVVMLAYYTKKFVWQTKAFQQKIWEETAKWTVITILGFISTMFLLSLNQNSKTKFPDDIIVKTQNSADTSKPQFNLNSK